MLRPGASVFDKFVLDRLCPNTEAVRAGDQHYRMEDAMEQQAREEGG